MDRPMTRLTGMAAFLLVYDRGTGTLVRKTRFDGSKEALRARFDAEAEVRSHTENRNRRARGRKRRCPASHAWTVLLEPDELVNRIA